MPARPGSGTLTGMTTGDIVMDMLRASDTGDFARFRRTLAPDCEWVNPVVRAEGADAIADNVAGFMSAFPDRRHDVSLLLESGAHVAVEGEWIATHQSGRPIRTPFAALIRVAAGRVAAVRLYLDTATLSAQFDASEAAA
jgi:ketosteroid isomerase-like protein